ncbi:MAG: hypothetical protein ABEH90_08905 [Halolamina sp.]
MTVPPSVCEPTDRLVRLLERLFQLTTVSSGAVLLAAVAALLFARVRSGSAPLPTDTPLSVPAVVGPADSGIAAVTDPSSAGSARPLVGAVSLALSGGTIAAPGWVI